ncbi:MAG: response regulator [Candidatus Tectomicrobia bacterium]|nr:response regulator [Candidatus Tectomicrobia bacterium]
MEVSVGRVGEWESGRVGEWESGRAGERESGRVDRILVVDDEKTIRLVFQSTLYRAGYEVVVAEDAREGLEALDRESFDVVVADIILPRMTGIDLLEQIRRKDPDLPVILITGEPNLETATEALRLGAYDYISKPINRQSLIHLVTRAVEKKRLLDEKKRLEADLRRKYIETEEMYGLIFRSVKAGIYQCEPDLEGRLTLINQAGAEILGYASPEEVIGRRAIDFYVDSEERTRLIESLKTKKMVNGAVLRLRRADGQEIDIELTCNLMMDEKGNPLYLHGIFRDISERKRLEQEMIQAEKFNLIGHIASGLAHEIGTPLNVISGTAEYLMMDIKGDNLMRVELEAILHQTTRITELIKRLLSLTRPSEDHFEAISLERPLKQALRFLEYRLQKEQIQHVTSFEPDLPPILGSSDQLEQVFLNLFVNAWHAMPQGGTLTISTQHVAEGAQIIVSDTGHGIAPEHLSRIFDPFFTTKGRDKGSGLGLAVTHRIVTNHAGTIEVVSKVNQGTTFTLTFPKAAK